MIHKKTLFARKSLLGFNKNLGAFFVKQMDIEPIYFEG